MTGEPSGHTERFLPVQFWCNFALPKGSFYAVEGWCERGPGLDSLGNSRFFEEMEGSGTPSQAEGRGFEPRFPLQFLPFQNPCKHCDEIED
jgi:hypothetical protein